MPEETPVKRTAEEKLAENRELFVQHATQAMRICSDAENHEGRLIKEIVIRPDYFFFSHEEETETDD